MDAPVGLILHPGSHLSHHLTKSLRVKIGDSFQFVRPEYPTQIYRGVVSALTPVVVALSPGLGPRMIGPWKKPFFDLAVGMLKGDGFEEIIEPSVCLGVRRLFPILADRAQIHWKKDQFERKKARYATKVQEASQLAGRPDKMEIKSPCGLAALIKENEQFILFLDEDPAATPMWEALSIPSPDIPILAVTGPEGGWSERERSMVLEKEKVGQACRASLGQRIFPGRLAPVVVASILSLIPREDRHEAIGP